jgi:phosphatidylglycerol---prolipoprotein diacylglyceryl transferase
MHPVLFHFGILTIYTYGFLIAVGFIVGILLAKREAVRVGIDPDAIMDLSFYVIIAAIVGSRLFYVITTPDVYISNPLEIFKIWNGGLVFYGGFIFALATALVYMKIKRMPVWETTDIIAPSIALGQFFGRLGCLSAGCCYGKICNLPWAVTFHNPRSLAPTGLPLHPTQLYDAFGNLVIFFLLWGLRKNKRFSGQIFWTYVPLYGMARIIVENFRDDFRGHVFFGLFSISQVIGCVMAIIGISMLVVLHRKNARN